MTTGDCVVDVLRDHAANLAGQVAVDTLGQHTGQDRAGKERVGGPRRFDARVQGEVGIARLAHEVRFIILPIGIVPRGEISARGRRARSTWPGCKIQKALLQLVRARRHGGDGRSHGPVIPARIREGHPGTSRAIGVSQALDFCLLGVLLERRKLMLGGGGTTFCGFTLRKN